MSDGVNFPELPLWEAMDFAQNCTEWANWYSTFTAPSPLDSTQSMDGDPWNFIWYFISSLPEDWLLPPEWSYPYLYGYILDWFGYNW